MPDSDDGWAAATRVPTPVDRRAFRQLTRGDLDASRDTVQAFAAAYPDETAGVVALNPVPPWQAWSTLGFEEMTPRERQGETDYYVGANGESLDYRAVSQLIADSPVPSDVPLHVLISTVAQCSSLQDICGRTYPAYEQIAKDLAQQWGEGRFSQVEAPHEIHLADMEAVQRAIDDVISRSRT